MNKVKNILVLQSRIEILVTEPGLGPVVPVCGFHTRPGHLFNIITYDHALTQCLHYGKSGSQRLPKIVMGLPNINARKSGIPNF